MELGSSSTEKRELGPLGPLEAAQRWGFIEEWPGKRHCIKERKGRLIETG